MKSKVINASKLFENNKWRADLFVHVGTGIKSESFELVPLDELVTESKIAIDPKDTSTEEFYYIGLENVEPIFGEPINVGLVNNEQVRSRSKRFSEGDILYGKLRPYLRKAIYVEPPYKSGLCSTEFIVLKAKADFILPLFLREILVSESVTNYVERMQGGAALPRVSSKDLLKIKIPLPPLSYQKKCELKIKTSRQKRRDLITQAKAFGDDGQKIISKIFL